MVLVPWIYRGRTQDLCPPPAAPEVSKPLHVTFTAILSSVQKKVKSMLCRSGALKEGSFTKDDDRFEALDSTKSVTTHPVPPTPKIKNSGQHWGQFEARRESFLVFYGPDKNVIRVIS